MSNHNGYQGRRLNCRGVTFSLCPWCCAGSIQHQGRATVRVARKERPKTALGWGQKDELPTMRAGPRSGMMSSEGGQGATLPALMKRDAAMAETSGAKGLRILIADRHPLVGGDYARCSPWRRGWGRSGGQGAHPGPHHVRHRRLGVPGHPGRSAERPAPRAAGPRAAPRDPRRVPGTDHSPSRHRPEMVGAEDQSFALPSRDWMMANTSSRVVA